jgi:hypothetical protein
MTIKLLEREMPRPTGRPGRVRQAATRQNHDRRSAATTRPVMVQRAQPDTGGTVRPRGRLAREWLARYAPAELACTLGAVLGASAAGQFGGAPTTVFAAVIAETVAFYTVLFVRDLRHRSSTRRPGGRALWTTLRNLLVEFGPAELLDTFAVRPLAMYVAATVVGDMLTGVILGKIAADAVFYTLAIIGYEVCKSVTTRVTANRAVATAAVVDGPAWPAESEHDGDPLAPSDRGARQGSLEDHRGRPLAA